MISRLTLRGYRGHVERTLAIPEPLGRTVLEGSSQRGKTSLLEALCACWWSCDLRGGAVPLEAIRDGEDAFTVEVTIAQGITYRASMSRKRTWKREMERPGREAERHGSEAAWREAIKALGRDVDLLRLVVVPSEWQRLAEGERGGAPLRDALVRALPPVELPPVVARLMDGRGLQVLPDDPDNAAGADARRRDAGRDVHRLEGQVATREQILAEATERHQRAQGPTPSEVEAARGTIEASGAWATYDAAERTHRVALRQHDETARAHEAWQQRRQALGERPAGSDNVTRLRAAYDAARLASDRASEDVARAVARRDALARLETWRERKAALPQEPPYDREAHADAREAWNAEADAEREARTAADGAQRAHEAAQAEADRLHAEAEAIRAAGDACPTCKRPGWSEAADRLDAAERAAEKAQRLAGKLLREADKLRAALAEFAAAVESAETALREHDAAERAHRDWREAAAIGPEPTVPEGPDVDAATTAREEAEATERQARAAIDTALSLAGAPAQWDAALRALGAEPAVREAPPAPVAPDVERPTQEAVTTARDTIRRAQEAAGAAGQRVGDLGQLRGDLDEAREALEAQREELSRRTALVQAWREAPSEAIREAVEALDCGPLTLRLAGEGVDVRVDGRDWHEPSTSRGRLAFAGLHLRAAIRRLMATRTPALAGLPIVVDGAADYATDAPALETWAACDVPGPLWILHTTPGDLRAVDLDAQHARMVG